MDTTQIIKDLAASQDHDLLNVRDFLERAGFNLAKSGGEARQWCLAQAREGNLHAQYVAAVLLSGGLFGSMEKIEALKLCRTAASKKFAPALLLLASFYESGWGDLDPAEDTALNLMKEAAAKGYGPALTATALFYLAKRKAPGDRDLAIEFLRRAAELDYPQAQATLAEELLQSGTPAELREGIALMQRAAEQSYPHAHRMLGFYYERGKYGLPLDSEKSRSHFARAKEIEETSWRGLV